MKQWLLFFVLLTTAAAQSPTPPSYFETHFLPSIPAVYQTAVFTPAIPCSQTYPCSIWYNGIAPVSFGHNYGSALPTGCFPGQVYYKTGTSSGAYVGTGGNPFACVWKPLSTGGGGATALTGTASISPGTVVDGLCPVQSPTITIAGVNPGDPVTIGAYSAVLPPGFYPTAQVTTPNTITVSLCNNSGLNQNPGSAIYTATVVH